MSSLHDDVARRTAVKPVEPECVSIQGGGSALVICQWRGESWALPWSQFVGARVCGSEAEAPLELSFANYLVTLTGKNLRGLLEEIAASRLACVRDLPGQYRRQMREDAPYVARIDVRPLPNSGSTGTRESS